MKLVRCCLSDQLENLSAVGTGREFKLVTSLLASVVALCNTVLYYFIIEAVSIV